MLHIIYNNVLPQPTTPTHVDHGSTHCLNQHIELGDFVFVLSFKPIHAYIILLTTKHKCLLHAKHKPYLI